MATALEPGVTRLGTPSDREVRITRAFDAPRRLVWAAWTSPEHQREWLTGPPGWTLPVVEDDFRPGGKWRRVWRKEDGEEMEMTGVNRVVNPPEKLVSTERWGPEWPETVNTLEFIEENGRTVVTLTILYPSKEARDAALQTGMKEGMDIGFVRLEEYLRKLA
ncbi:MAG TPA: SRPBCC family protein [Gemmatimonadales bacterium]|nr:SRPBCC family protein [Gemmatimonadales bacterium]